MLAQQKCAVSVLHWCAASLVAGVLEELVDALLDVDEGGEVSVAEVDGLPALELEAVVVGHGEVLTRRRRRAVRCSGRRRRGAVTGASQGAMVVAAQGGRVVAVACTGGIR